MRFLASMILSAALAVPVMAQPRPGLDNNPKAEIERLKDRLKELEAKQKQSGDSDKKKDGDKKLDAKQGEQKGEQREDKKGDDKKPEAKKGEQKGEQRDEQRGPGARGPQGSGGFGPPGMRGREGGPGFRGPMGGLDGAGFNFPGMNNLTQEEQATFKKLVAKMHSQGPDRKPDAQKQPEGGDRKREAPKGSNLEERLDRLEKMVQELARSNRGR